MKTSFLQRLLRLKLELNMDTDQEVAAALGFPPTTFNERKRRGSFPVDRLGSVARALPHLGIDVDFVLTGERHGAPSAASANTDDFTPPTFEEMAAFMDAEMVRMGMTQGATA